jgi:hypothetical protein
LLSRKSIRESGTSSSTTATTGGTIGNNNNNNMSTMGGSIASEKSTSYRRTADLNNTAIVPMDSAGITTNDIIASGSSTIAGDIKPRSLRFTWSMKTTSSMDPADMMKEIRKVMCLCVVRRSLS